MLEVFQKILNTRNRTLVGIGVSGGIEAFDGQVINCTVRNFVTGLSISVKGFVVRKSDFETIPIRIDNFIPTADGSEQVFFDIALPEGLLLFCDVAVNGTTLVREGDCFVSIKLQDQRTNISSSTITGTLASGYLTNSKNVSFPFTGNRDMTEGNGKSTIISVTAPAAGNNFTYTVPNHRRLRVNAVSFELNTDANVANRTLLLEFTEVGGANGLLFPSIKNLVASHIGFYSFAMIGTAETILTQSTNDFINVPMPQGIELHAGDTIKTLVSNLQVGDLFTRIRIYGQLWVDVGTNTGTSGGGGGAQ
jgi:hypothetical protein